MTRKIFLDLSDKDFKRLSNAKEEAKINGECANWEEFILKNCLKGG